MHRIATLLLVLLALSACADEVTGPSDPPEPSPTEPSDSDPLVSSRAIGAAPDYNLDRIGAVRLGGETHLFVLAHNAEAAILSVSEERAERLRTIRHEPDFPALRDRPDAPELPKEGGILYWRQKHLWLETLPSAQDTTCLELKMEAQPEVLSATGGASVEAKDQKLIVTLPPGSGLEVTGESYPIAGWPLEVNPIEGTLHIGKAGDPLESERTLRLRDYHALAAANLDGTGGKEVVVFGGGLYGRAEEVIPDARETMLIGPDLQREVGPPKLGCASRRAFASSEESVQVKCARGQFDNEWLIEGGEFVGGPTGETSKGRTDPCKGLEMIAEGHVPEPPEEALCAEADFDGDDQLELIVASPAGKLQFEVMRHDLSRPPA